MIVSAPASASLCVLAVYFQRGAGLAPGTRVAIMLPNLLQYPVLIPVADERSEQAVKIIVVRSDASRTADALVAHCKRYLAGYKVPRQVSFRDQPLPKSNIGKILRRVVKDEECDRERHQNLRGTSN